MSLAGNNKHAERPEFILMLTLNDQTIPDALERYAELGASRLRFVGFKDIGIPGDQLRQLTAHAHEEGRKVFLEVVSESREAELRSAQMAVDLGVDYLIGGVRPRAVLELLAGTGISYFPYVGTVVGHPCKLEGTLEGICEQAAEVLRTGADGVNLLGYRYLDGDPLKLIGSVAQAVHSRVIVAGDITRPTQLAELAAARVFAFTIGGAVVERRFGGRSTFADEVESVLDSVPEYPADAR